MNSAAESRFPRGHEPQFAFGRDRRQHIEMKAFASVADNRGFPAYPPGRPGMKVRSHAAPIGKKHDSTLLFRQGANLGEIPLDPLFDQRRIPCSNARLQRFWQRQPHLRQTIDPCTEIALSLMPYWLCRIPACRSSLSSRAQREITAFEADFSMSRYCRSISTGTPSTASDARSPCAREAHPIRQHDRLPTTQIPRASVKTTLASTRHRR